MSIGSAIASLAFPGLGQALAGRRTAAWAWLVLGVVSPLAALVSVWPVVAVVLVHLASAVDAARQPRGPSAVIPIVAACVAPFVALFAIRAMVVEPFKVPSSSMLPTIEIGDYFYIDKLVRSPQRGDIIVFRQPCTPERDFDKRVVAVGGDTVEVRCDVVYVNGVAAPLELVDANATYQDEGPDGEHISREASRHRETLDGRSYDVFHARDRGVRDAPRDGDMKDFPNLSRREPPSCKSDPGAIDGAPAANQQAGVLRPGKPGGPCDPQLAYVVPGGHVFVLGDNRSNSNDSRFWGSVPIENIKGIAVGVVWPLGRVGAIR